MPMPKGHRSEHGYATTEAFDGGLSYREIAEIMTDEGSKMNHSSVRNYMISALSKIAGEMMAVAGAHPDDRRVRQVAGDPRFQSALCGIIRDRIDQ